MRMNMRLMINMNLDENNEDDKENVFKLFYDIFKIVEKLIIKKYISMSFLDKIHNNISVSTDDLLTIKNEFIGNIFHDDTELHVLNLDDFSNIEVSFLIHDMLTNKELLEICNNIHKELSNCKESKKAIIKRRIVQIQKVLLENV